MASDNTILSPNNGVGDSMRDLADASGNKWIPAVATYAVTISPGANVLQIVTASNGLPVAQQGAWTVTANAGSGAFTVAQGTAANLNATVVGTGTFATQAAQSGTWTVQPGNTANTTAWLVTGAGGTFPVTGTFWQTTQPVSIAANVTVVGTGTFVVQAAQSGTWNIGTVTTVSAVTAITNPLPAGTNLLGQIAAAQQVASLFNGTTAVTPQYAAITASSSGATNVVAGVSGKKVYILRWSLSANGNVNVNWQSHTTTGTATGLHYMTQYASAGGAYCPAGIFATVAGEGLDINLSAAVAVGGELTYVQF